MVRRGATIAALDAVKQSFSVASIAAVHEQFSVSVHAVDALGHPPPQLMRKVDPSDPARTISKLARMATMRSNSTPIVRPFGLA